MRILPTTRRRAWAAARGLRAVDGSAAASLRAAAALFAALAVLVAWTCGRGEPPRTGSESQAASEEPGATRERTRRVSLGSVSEPELVSDPRAYDTQPDLSLDAAGDPWVVWVAESESEGDRILAARRGPAGWEQPEVVTQEAGMYLRPVVERSGDGLVVAWTATGEETAIWSARRTPAGWSAPERGTPAGAHAFNAELCASPDGGLWLVWQGRSGEGFDLFLARRGAAEAGWGEPVRVTEAAGNDWDPSIACDSGGRLWIVWSAYRDFDYDLHVASYADGALSSEITPTDHRAYDLHPAVALDADDRLWIAWDRITIEGHGSSGTGVREGDALLNQPAPDSTKAEVFVWCLQDGRVLMPADQPRGGPATHRVTNAGFPRVACDAAGGVWVAYRNWSFKHDEPHAYWWDVAVARYSGDAWSAVEILPRSDGELEEPALACAGASAWVAAEMEHRHTAPAGAPHPEDGSSSFDFGHMWPVMPQGENGEVYATRLTPAGETAPPVLRPAPAPSPEPAPLAASASLAKKVRHSIEYRGETLQVLFGDTHRHSNVSRCQAGQDATVVDLHRFALDVHRHDFFVVSDHSNQTSDFDVWSSHKLAELFNMPGLLATLLGYEISNGFPTGHKNVIFPGRMAKVLRQGIDRAINGPEIWASLAGEEAITIPHTSAFPSGTDWEDHDPEYERLVEVFQARTGSSEHAGAPRLYAKATNALGFVHAALNKGYRLGIIASTDHGFGATYAVVFARGVTRADVYEALHERRCYGSTAYGILLDVRADGHLMGEEFEAESGVELAIDVRAYAPLADVVIFADGRIAREWTAAELGAEQASLAWTEPDPPPPGSPARWYYVRVMLADGELAWSSPVWVHY